MKVKHTKNGNVKLVLSAEQAEKLLTIINFSSYIMDAGKTNDSHEAVSWDIHRAMNDAGVAQS